MLAGISQELRTRAAFDRCVGAGGHSGLEIGFACVRITQQADHPMCSWLIIIVDVILK